MTKSLINEVKQKSINHMQYIDFCFIELTISLLRYLLTPVTEQTTSPAHWDYHGTVNCLSLVFLVTKNF